MTVSAFHKIDQPTNLRSMIGESLSAAIISGELAAGSLVSVPTLAARFDVSATPVREAMLDLEQRGFVKSVRNKGFRVIAMSDRDLAEVIELRQLLEAPIMGAIAKDFPVQSLPEWQVKAKTIKNFAEEGDLVRFIAADRNFHLELLQLHGNSRLVEAVRELRFQTRMVNLIRMTKSKELGEAAQEHFTMLQLLADGKAAEVESLTVLHLAHVIGWWSDH
jgi:DNA-binding GntR family transcriptional regulator